jgi:hypothetical protein
MKTLFLTILIFIYSLSGFSQNIDLKVGSVTLPEGNEHINSDAAMAHIQHKFKGDRMATTTVVGTGTIYKIADVLVILRSKEVKVEEGHLAKIKKGLDNIYRKNSTYTSEIKTINNNVVLITNSTLNGIGYYDIYANNASNSKFITAVIEYNIADSVKSQKIAQHLINHLKFTN